MSTPIFIGCDIGTSGTKAVAVDVKGNILSQEIGRASCRERV